MKYLNDAIYSNSEIIEEAILKSNKDMRLSAAHIDFFDGFILNINRILA